MKKIINGRVYNTETSIEIAFSSGGQGRSDFRYFEETLRKTHKGLFFLEGFGGPMTRWAKTDGNTSWGSSGLQAISAEEALAWCERHDVDVDIVAKHFTLEEA